MKWLVAIAVVLASASIVVPALLQIRAGVTPAERLDQIHELAGF
jgi:hypothetical protein